VTLATGFGHTHIGRSWHGTPLEDDCPCGKAPCGLVDSEKIDSDCPQHGGEFAKTMRQIHWAAECAAPAPVGCLRERTAT
jgi:hypothetical protein